MMYDDDDDDDDDDDEDYNVPMRTGMRWNKGQGWWELWLFEAINCRRFV